MTDKEFQTRIERLERNLNERDPTSNYMTPIDLLRDLIAAARKGLEYEDRQDPLPTPTEAAPMGESSELSSEGQGELDAGGVRHLSAKRDNVQSGSPAKPSPQADAGEIVRGLNEQRLHSNYRLCQAAASLIERQAARIKELEAPTEAAPMGEENGRDVEASLCGASHRDGEPSSESQSRRMAEEAGEALPPVPSPQGIDVGEICRRLRDWDYVAWNSGKGDVPSHLMKRAASLIERQAAEIKRLGIVLDEKIEQIVDAEGHLKVCKEE